MAARALGSRWPRGLEGVLAPAGAGSRGGLREAAVAADFGLIIFRGVCGEFLCIESVVGAWRADTGGARIGPFDVKGEFSCAGAGAGAGRAKDVSGRLMAAKSVAVKGDGVGSNAASPRARYCSDEESNESGKLVADNPVIL